MKVDPLASMRLWAVDVEIGGQTFTIPPLPAADWWPALSSLDPDGVFALIPGDDLDEVLLTGEIGQEDAAAAILDAIEEITGRTPQAAYVLAAAAEHSWPIISGHLAQHGFRWDVMPIGAALDAIYAVLCERMSEESRKKLDALLDKPMPGQARAIDREQAMTDFAELAGPRPTGGATVPLEQSTGAPSGGTPPRTRRQSRPPRPRGQSSGPTARPPTPGHSDRVATSASPPGAVAPASGIAPRPRPRAGRKPTPPRSAGPAAQPAPPS